MKERIDKLIQMLSQQREKVLDGYLTALENYDGPRSFNSASELHDIDHHITNLHLEIKRMKAEEAVHA